jgi:hypothetical protein
VIWQKALLRLFAAQAGAILIIPILANSTLVHLLTVAAVLLVENFPSRAVFLVFLSMYVQE